MWSAVLATPRGFGASDTYGKDLPSSHKIDILMFSPQQSYSSLEAKVDTFKKTLAFWREGLNFGALYLQKIKNSLIVI